ncbi:MAG: tetratricopeptide repeat protein, partial [Bacteroidota bacterium]
DRLEGDYSGALRYHQKALDLHLKQGDQRYIATDYHNIGALFRHSKDYEKAKRYLHKGLRLREAIQDSIELPTSYMQIGIVCRKMKQLDSAAYYYDRAHEIASLRKDRAMLVKVNGNRAALKHFLKDYSKAIEINLADIPYLEEEGLSESLSTRYNNIARAYNKLQDYPKVIEYISKAIEIDERERYLKVLCEHLLLRSTVSRKMRDHESALLDYRNYRKVRDTVLNLAQVEKFTAQKLLSNMNNGN